MYEMTIILFSSARCHQSFGISLDLKNVGVSQSLSRLIYALTTHLMNMNNKFLMVSIEVY